MKGIANDPSSLQETSDVSQRGTNENESRPIRLLIVNGPRRKLGGTEDYLSSIIPELHHRGFKLAFLSDLDSQQDRSPIDLPQGVPAWCVAHVGETAALDAVRNWRPELIYVHGAFKVTFERQLIQIAPAVYFAHNYFGTCISGHKAHQWPVARPCNSTLGWPCLIKYLPLRCGGLSPVTMLRRYLVEKKRLENVRLYSGIVTHSEHMRQEYINHGLLPARVFNFAYEVGASGQPANLAATLINVQIGPARSPQPGPKPHRLLFLGRMEKLKGGKTLIDAVPRLHASLKTPIQVTLAGDGPERKHWQHCARKVEDHCPGSSFNFPGWLSKDQVAWHLENTDVLVVPSLWPEPFGRVGIQAGHYGVPVAAFSVGGIPEWLKDGVNGKLAPADPPTASGLAAAILGCLDESSAAELKQGSRIIAAKFSTVVHLDRLISVFRLTLNGNN